MLLPIPSNRASLRAFWLVLSFAVGGVLGVLSSIPARLDLAAASFVGIVAALALALPGLLFPYEVAIPYRAWNWSVRRFSVLAQRWVTGVCFWTILPVLRARRRLAGTESSPGFERSPGGTSRWHARGTQDAATYPDQHRRGAREGDRGVWIAPLARWMRSAGPSASWALLPFILLIERLDTGSRKGEGPPANIYTLY